METSDAFVCRKCGTKTYPRHARCPACGGTQFDALALEGSATLLSFTRVYMLSLDYTERFIALGIVEFANGLRALGRLFVGEPKIGMNLKAEIGTVKVRDGEPVKGLCFRETH